MGIAVVGVGANLGAREASIWAARALLDARDEIEVLGSSPLYETEPLGPPQPRYLNAAFRLYTTLSPPELLRVLLRTERRLGRDRAASKRWGPRSIDLDLLWDERGSHETNSLRVPHPELEQRDFALAPLLDVAPELSSIFEPALEGVGGRPALWDRSAAVEVGSEGERIEIEVQADSLVEACALTVRFPNASGRPWSTRHIITDSNPEAWAIALRDLLHSGFVIHCASISHCSEAQWIAHFHGVNLAIPLGTDVRLQTTSGSVRRQRARLSMAATTR